MPQWENMQQQKRCHNEKDATMKKCRTEKRCSNETTKQSGQRRICQNKLEKIHTKNEAKIFIIGTKA